jgi:2Fe-2S ferredoxin
LYKIKVNYEGYERSPSLLKKVKKNQTLLEVLLDHQINISHVCGGICSCNTCLIHVEKGGEFLEPKTVKEEHFLKRNYYARAHSRLACQCLLLDGRGELELTIPEQGSTED